MEACSVTLTGILAYDPKFSHSKNGDPSLMLTLKVRTRSHWTRWIKVRASGTLAIRSAESYHAGDRVTVRGDDLDAWGKIDNRPDGSQDDGPRVQSWVFLTAYDIAMSTQTDTVASGQAVRRAEQAGDPDEGRAQPSLSVEEQANQSVLSGTLA